MKRIIIDYAKLTPEILAMLVEKYPDGYESEDIIRYTRMREGKEEMVRCLEVVTEEIIYLVRASDKLESAMEEFDPEEFEEDNVLQESDHQEEETETTD